MKLVADTNLRALVLAAGALTLTACPEKEEETASATGPTTTTPTTEAPSTETSTETTETPTTGTAGETTESTTTPDATTEATTSEPTTSEPTTTEVTTTSTTTEAMTTTEETTVDPVDLDAACQSACVVFFECVPRPPFPDMAACAADCAGALGQGEGCLEATVAFNLCLGEMTCEEFEDAFFNEEFGPCQDEFAGMLGSCGD